jgi:ArsR family transcriptional regulator
MEMFEACEAFSSLSQETRLNVFRFLIQYGRDGAVPGTLAKELKIPDNTLSFHLSHMSKAGLVTSKKNGRSITYYANTNLMSELVGYLQENCCIREESTKSKTNCGKRKC